MAYATTTHPVWSLAPSGGAFSRGGSASPAPPSLCSVMAGELRAHWGPSIGPTSTITERDGGIKSSPLNSHNPKDTRAVWVSQQQHALASSNNTSQSSTGGQAEEMLGPTVLSMRNPPQPFSGGNSTRHSLLQADFQQPEPKAQLRHLLMHHSHKCTHLLV